MRIALFHNLPSGGARRFTLQQVKRLAERGHEIEAFFPSTADERTDSMAPFVKRQHQYSITAPVFYSKRIPLVTPYIHAQQSIAFLRENERLNWQIADEINQSGFDLVFTADDLFMICPYLLRYVALPSTAYIHSIQRPHFYSSDHHISRNGIEQIKYWFYKPAQAAFNTRYKRDEVINAQKTTALLTNSAYSARILRDWYRREVKVNYPGIDGDVFRPLGIEKVNDVLCVAALIPQKGYRFLIQSLSLIPLCMRPRLFIAANARDVQEEKEELALAERLGVVLHIECISDTDQLVRVYNQAKVFVYAPYLESLGMAPLEAQACGTPVVAVGEGGVLETVKDGVTGWLVNRDPQVFARKVVELLSDPVQCERLGRNGSDFIRTNWNWQKSIDDLEGILSSNQVKR